MKKALAGPAKRTAKRQPERRGIVAAARRRVNSLAGAGTKLSRRLDRRADRLLRAAEPVLLALGRDARRIWERWRRRLARVGRPVYARAGRLLRWCGRRLRPAAVLLLRLLGFADRLVRRVAAWATRTSTRASGVVTPQRATAGVVVGSALCLLAAQFVDYRGVEVGQPGYAGLPGAAIAPRVGLETPLDAHSFLMFPIALAAIVLGVLAARRRRPEGLGRTIFLLGALGALLVMLIDRPAGLDASAQSVRFAGAEAVLTEGFYAQLAAAAGLMLGGALLVLAPKAAARYHARPCRTRINWSERVASGLRRRRRRRASSRGRGARSRSPRRSGVASAPASPR